MKSVNENLIRDMVYSQRKSYIQVSEILKEKFPGKIVFFTQIRSKILPGEINISKG